MCVSTCTLEVELFHVLLRIQSLNQRLAFLIYAGMFEYFVYSFAHLHLNAPRCGVLIIEFIT